MSPACEWLLRGKSMANIFFGRGKKEKLIVECSNIGLRALQLVVTEEEEMVIEKAFFAPWSYFLPQTEDDFLANFDTILKSLSAYCPPKQYSVYFCASDPSNYDRWIQTSKIEDEEELEEYLLGKKVMKSEENWNSEAIILGDSVSELKSAQDVLMHAHKRDFAQNCMDSLEDQGYELEALDFPTQGLAAYYDFYLEEGRPAHDVMISIGWENSILAIFHDGKLRFSHHLNFRLCDFMVLIKDKMQLDEQTATSITRNELFDVVLAGAASSSGLMEEITDEVKEELEYLLDEIKRLFAFYVARVIEWKIEGIERIMFFGIEARIEALYNYLASAFTVPCNRIIPLDSMNYSEEARARIEKEGSIEHLVNAFGLALRHLEEEE